MELSYIIDATRLGTLHTTAWWRWGLTQAGALLAEEATQAVVEGHSPERVFPLGREARDLKEASAYYRALRRIVTDSSLQVVSEEGGLIIDAYLYDTVLRVGIRAGLHSPDWARFHEDGSLRDPPPVRLWPRVPPSPESASSSSSSSSSGGPRLPP